MMRCGDCRHWGDGEDAGQPFRRCLAVVHDKPRLAGQELEWKGLDRTDPGDAGEIAEHDAMQARKAVVQDRSGYFAALRCREDFGCVLFEAKGPGEG